MSIARYQGLCTSSVLASTLGSTTHQPPVGAPNATATSATAAKTAEGAAQKPPSPMGNAATGAAAGAASAAARQASGAGRQAGAAVSSSRAFSEGWAAIPPVARTLGLAGGAARHIRHQPTATRLPQAVIRPASGTAHTVNPRVTLPLQWLPSSMLVP